MPAKKTHEEYVDDLKYFYGNEFKAIKQYTGNDNTMTFKHKCGCEFDLTSAVRAFNRGLRCPICGFIDLSTIEKIQAVLTERYNNEYELINYNNLKEPINVKTKVNILHKTCGKIIETTIDDFFNHAKICKECKKERNKFTKKDFEKYLVDNNETEYKILSDYIKNVDTPISLLHKTCNREFDMAVSKFKCGQRCPHCAEDAKRLTDKEIKERLDSVNTDNEYEYSWSEYKNVQSDIHVYHKVCGGEYDYPFADIVYHNYKCPICNAANSEKIIKKYLNENHINYDWHYSFPDCKDKNPLEFDFRINLNGGKYFMLEFNGIQHYEPVEFFGGQEKFELQQKHDNIKRQYCIDNNIPLLEIHYKDKDKMFDILNDYINQL